MAADGKQAGAVAGLRRAWAELADAAHHRPGSGGRRSFSSARALVGTGARARTLAAVCTLLQGRRPRLRGIPAGGPALPVLPFWIVYEHLLSDLRQGTAIGGPDAAGELSLEHSISRRRLGCAVQAREVDLSFRSSSGTGHSAAGSVVAALVAGGPSVWRDLAPVAARLHQLLREVHLLGGRLCLG